MDTKKAASQAAGEHSTKVRNFFLFPTRLLQEILHSQDGFDKCINIAIFHSAITMMNKSTFQISGKEMISIYREYKKYKMAFSAFSSETHVWFNELIEEDDEASIIHLADDRDLSQPEEIDLYAAIRRAFSLLNLNSYIGVYMIVFRSKYSHDSLNWKKSLVPVNTTFINSCRAYALKSRKNE